MPRRPFVLALRLSLLLAITASAALVVDYRNVGDPAFCGTGSGCFAVRLSPVTASIGKTLPMSLPNLGLIAFVVLFGLSLVARTRLAKRVFAGFMTIAGLAAGVLLVLQGVTIKAWCPWCVAVDTSAIAGAACALVLAFGAADDPADAAYTGPRVRLLWSAIASAAVAMPFLWARYPVIPPMPPDIAAQQVPGKLTLVEFTDFECPYCRALHPVLRDLEERHAGKVTLVRRMMPLPSHLGARPAALLYSCVPEADKERVADALYNVDEAELTHTGCLDLAARLGFNREAIERVMDGPETRAALERDEAMFERLGRAGLPRTFIGSRVVIGYNPDRVRELVELGSAGERPQLPPALMFVALALLFSAGVALTERQLRSTSVTPAG